MAISKTIKNEVSIPARVISSNSNTLTVVVVDANGQPINGAHVSIKPSDASVITNGAGEAQFTLGGATKYEITASNGNDTVIVPYYITPNGATRLVVNPVYVKSVEAKLHPTNNIFASPVFTGICILALIIIFVVAWKRYKRGKE